MSAVEKTVVDWRSCLRHVGCCLCLLSRAEKNQRPLDRHRRLLRVIDQLSFLQ
jgi:hypothetical protein